MSRRIPYPIATVAAFMIVYGSSFFMVLASDGQSESGFRGHDGFEICYQVLLKPAPKMWQWWCYATAWLTNPLLWFATIATFCRYPRIAICLSISAMLHVLPILFAVDFIPNGPAYYVWVSSALILIAGNVYLIRKGK